MNRKQKVLLYVFITLAFLSVVLEYFCTGKAFLYYFEFAVMAVLLLTSLLIQKRHLEHKLIGAAFIFMLIGDFFLIMPNTWENAETDLSLYGMGGFFISYIFLIAAFQRNFCLGKAGIITAMPFISLFSLTVKMLIPYTKGIMLAAALVFGSMLCYMAWTLVCTFYRKYFSFKVSVIASIFAVIIFFSDLAVAYELFYPFIENYQPWTGMFVRGTFTAGWTLLAVILLEEDIIDKS